VRRKIIGHYGMSLNTTSQILLTKKTLKYNYALGCYVSDDIQSINMCLFILEIDVNTFIYILARWLSILIGFLPRNPRKKHFTVLGFY
jgi:hypothetical protein